MHNSTPKVIYLKDYAPPDFLIPSVDLDISLFDGHALVRARLDVRRNPKAADQAAPLRLDGDELQLVSVSIDGKDLPPEAYDAAADRLILRDMPQACVVETVVRLQPHANTKLMGLYASKSGYFTQCEAEGFRRITYFLDRPDVMSRYTTTLRADTGRYPYLLSNGNPIAGGNEAGERHWARWEDPFPKPAYLFAMVAADLDRLRDTFTTRSGRVVQLSVFVERGKLDQAGFAMLALKKSMQWDERVFGL